jgi:DNA-directed RNA polymerase specialized sigma subunit
MSLTKNNEQERILQNEKLAMKLAHRYAKRYQGRHDYDDLAQAARQGFFQGASPSVSIARTMRSVMC